MKLKSYSWQMFSLEVPNNKAADDWHECPPLLKAQNISCQFYSWAMLLFFLFFLNKLM